MSYCDGTGNTTSCDSELFRVSDSGLLLNTPIQTVHRLNLLVGNNGSSVRLTSPTYYGILTGTDMISECIVVNSDVVAIPSQGAYYIDQYDPSGNGNINNFYTLRQIYTNSCISPQITLSSGAVKVYNTLVIEGVATSTNADGVDGVMFFMEVQSPDFPVVSSGISIEIPDDGSCIGFVTYSTDPEAGPEPSYFSIQTVSTTNLGTGTLGGILFEVVLGFGSTHPIVDTGNYIDLLLNMAIYAN
jgi:hypothetical protein